LITHRLNKISRSFGFVVDASAILFTSNHATYFCAVAEFNEIRVLIPIDNHNHIRYTPAATKGLVSLEPYRTSEYNSRYRKTGVWIGGLPACVVA
jgi:hypothetical protein